jgi:hypothetical protein
MVVDMLEGSVVIESVEEETELSQICIELALEQTYLFPVLESPVVIAVCLLMIFDYFVQSLEVLLAVVNLLRSTVLETV